MSSENKKEHTEQSTWLDPSPLSNMEFERAEGDYFSHNLKQLNANEYPKNNLVERRNNLVIALNNLSAASRLTGFQIASDSPVYRRNLESRYDDVDAVSGKSSEALNRHLKNSKVAFAKAVGMQSMIDINPDQEEEIKKDTRRMYGDFLVEFADAKGKNNRENYKKSLLKQEEGERLMKSSPEKRLEFPDAIGAISLRNVSDLSDEESSQATDKLDTYERVEVLDKDPEVGFIPSTNLEKNVTLTFLDYLDNPEYPLGIKNQILEIVRAQQKAYPDNPSKGLEEGRRAAVSVTHLIGDFYQKSTGDEKALSDFDRAVSDILNPNLTLDVAGIEKDNPGFVRLVRHIDQKEFLEDGEVKPVYVSTKKGTKQKRVLDRIPYRTRRNEDIENYYGKNKIPEDPYTDPQRTEKFNKWLEVRLKTMKIGEVRQIIKEAVENQRTRSEFHKSRLEELAEYDTSLPRALKLASATASRYLEDLK